MKKFMNIMLALALTTGLATVTLAQDAPKKEGAKKKGGKKGKTDTTDTTKAPKGKGKKGKTTDDKK